MHSTVLIRPYIKIHQQCCLSFSALKPPHKNTFRFAHTRLITLASTCTVTMFRNFKLCSVCFCSSVVYARKSEVQDCYFFHHSMAMYDVFFFSRTMQSIQSCTLMARKRKKTFSNKQKKKMLRISIDYSSKKTMW